MNTNKEITLTMEINEIKDHGTRTRAEMIQALSRAYRDSSLAGKNGQIIIERTDKE